jgi:hypothetical protein
MYVPTIQTAIMLAAMLESKTWAAMLAAGIFDTSALAATSLGGEYVNVPKLNHMDDFAAQALQSVSAGTFTASSSTDDKAVVLHAYTSAKWYKSQLRQSNVDNLSALLSRTAGEKFAKRMAQMSVKLLDGAIDGVDTPSSNCHTKSTTAAISVSAIRQAKQLMGDEADKLTTLIMHSKVWGDLLRDMTENYKIDVVSGAVINNGKLQGVLGLQNIIVTDLAPSAAGATSSAGDDLYSSFIVGPKALGLAFQQAPNEENDQDITNKDSIIYKKIDMAYVVHLLGMAWGSTANPTDAAFTTASNWNEAYQDHREVLATKLVSYGGVYA